MNACAFGAPSTFSFKAVVRVYVPAVTSWLVPSPSRTVKSSTEPIVSFAVPDESSTRTLPLALPSSVPGK